MVVVVVVVGHGSCRRHGHSCGGWGDSRSGSCRLLLLLVVEPHPLTRGDLLAVIAGLVVVEHRD